MTQQEQEEQQIQRCQYCDKVLEGVELDYTICESCYNDEMNDITKDWYPTRW